MSVSKIPMPTEDKETFQIPIGIPVRVPEGVELTEQNKSSKSKRKQVGPEEGKHLDQDDDRLSSDEDTKKLNDEVDSILAEVNPDGPDPFEHSSCLLAFNINDIWIKSSKLDPIKSIPGKDGGITHKYAIIKDTQNRNTIILFQLMFMYIFSVIQLMDWNVLVSNKFQVKF